VLRSNIHFSSVDTPIRSILVTSTLPGEGKSVTASNLAIAMVLDGKNVILVETDLRQPMLHQTFGLDPNPGVTDVLAGDAALEEALRETSVPGLLLLPSGPVPPNPAELLNTRAMRQLHDTLKERADFVIFDSSPCLVTADAHVLAAQLDGVLYVVQLGEVKKTAVRHVREMLQQAHARILGIVFNKIDLTSRRDDYYFGYYRYYDADRSVGMSGVVQSRPVSRRADLPPGVDTTTAIARRMKDDREEKE
jgi:capsular exopolysaccharide synthesis family protein